MFYTYVIQSGKNMEFYVGFTSRLEEQIDRT